MLKKLVWTYDLIGNSVITPTFFEQHLSSSLKCLGLSLKKKRKAYREGVFWMGVVCCWPVPMGQTRMGPTSRRRLTGTKQKEMGRQMAVGSQLASLSPARRPGHKRSERQQCRRAGGEADGYVGQCIKRQTVTQTDVQTRDYRGATSMTMIDTNTLRDAPAIVSRCNTKSSTPHTQCV